MGDGFGLGDGLGFGEGLGFGFGVSASFFSFFWRSCSSLFFLEDVHGWIVSIAFCNRLAPDLPAALPCASYPRERLARTLHSGPSVFAIWP